jgi:hypothetical protein
MICALIPFVVGGSKEIPILYLYSPAFLMGFLGILMLVTLVPFNVPIGIDSQARGTPLRPFVFTQLKTLSLLMVSRTGNSEYD